MRKSILVVSLFAVALLAPSSAQAGKYRLMPSDAERVMLRAKATMLRTYGGDRYQFHYCTSDFDDAFNDAPPTSPAKRPPYYCWAEVAGVTNAEDVLAEGSDPIEGPVEFSLFLPMRLTGRSCKRVRVENLALGNVFRFNGCPR